ncbi:lactonase family protein [Novosphingobium flavum]|uniref:Lactonase family protein n=1 Tax=Novosphingobium flavum TaxID=1778672 RepID=A0A7X1KMT1_9SPHN|nr:beta-propeller fold lactonase family protein [Novosphingobium flavum]MBC2666688.1 lactonase family protein [Novosphingobium flavum]
MSRLVAYVGTYGVAPGTKGGGIYGLAVSDDGRGLTALNHAPEPKDAGYLVHAADTGTLYAVDERKTDGRGPVDKPAAVHALSVDPVSGELTWRNAQIAPGPRPTFLDYSAEKRLLVSANHGDFQHVEKVYRRPDGSWAVDYVYDDSTAVLFAVEDDGRVGAIEDIHIFEGHGKDPNFSPQNGGHAQSNPHAHCAVIDPSGQFVIVCDKGTDRIVVFRLVGSSLEGASVLQMAEEVGPRHIAFDPVSGLAYATCEFSSELAALRLDPASGDLTVLERVSTVSPAYHGPNEPAEVRVHPAGGHVYVNNRGEDTLAWFRVDAAGALQPAGAVPLAPSIHPGLAARSFTFAPSGRFMLVADRPAHLVHSYAVCPDTGNLTWLAQAPVPDPAFIALVELGQSDNETGESE